MTSISRIRIALGAMLIALLTACGAGGDTLLSGVGSGGTGGATGGTPTTVLGQIRGFGSVIVNGVRFDESGAVVVDDEGRRLAADELRLGMVVLLDGTSDPATLTGVASEIRVISALRGPIQSVSATTESLVVMGVTVRVPATAVLEGVAALSGLVAGDDVEIHGYLDSSIGVLTATRVERLTGVPTSFRARGVAGQVDRTARTLRLGALQVDYSSATLVGLPDGPKTGHVLKLVSNLAPTGAGTWKVDSVELVAAPTLPESSRASLEGKVSGYQGTSAFDVQGVRVDASTARFVGGTPASLADGVRVEVEGTFSGGVLVATEVEVEDEEQHALEFEVEGAITEVTGPYAFVVRGTAVDASAARLENGTAASITVGRRVHATGPSVGGVLRAERVEFED